MTATPSCPNPTAATSPAPSPATPDGSAIASERLWARVAEHVRGAALDEDLALAARWDATPTDPGSGTDAGSGSRSVVVGVPTVSVDHALADLAAHDLLPPASSDHAVWIGAIAYDAAACVEPAIRAGAGSRDMPGTPGVSWRRLDHPAVLRGDDPVDLPRASDGPGYALSDVRSVAGADAYRRAVDRVLAYIRAGDVYQVNIAHELRATLRGASGVEQSVPTTPTISSCPSWASARAFAADLLASAQPRHGVYVEGRHTDGRRWAVCSASPERFVHYARVSGIVRTTPMKGTRPIGDDPGALDRSDKDRAELAMIVDLMRNDLGRVCAPGTMRVDAGRRVEAHGASVWQAVADVSGTLRDNASPTDLLAATLAPGSITGAPKIRAMQIIAELETSMGLMPSGRGWYCGAAGWMDATGLGLNVMIRTATITEVHDAHGQPTGALDVVFPVGAGLVADSDPDAEWRETLAKAEVFTRLAEKGQAR